MPNTHQVSGELGSPNSVLPITAPGPIAKKNHISTAIQAMGMRARLRWGTEALARRNR